MSAIKNVSKFLIIFYNENCSAYLGCTEKDATHHHRPGDSVLERKADRLAKDLRLVVAAGSVVGGLL